MEGNQRDVEVIANELADATDTDVLLYNAPIDPAFERGLVDGVCVRRRRKNVTLILVTLGGEADSAFRIARCLQLKYEKFTLFVTGYCKSAGTLVALGANELVFADCGELGPLDVQMTKKDSLYEVQSGLAVNAALAALSDKAYLAFERFFLNTEERSGGQITVSTAGELATKLATGLFAPLFAQLDPLHVGEAARAMQVADQYGHRLWFKSKNFELSSLSHLISHYPSHGFVIDKDEAATVFERVRSPLALESELAQALDDVARIPLRPDYPSVSFLCKELPAPVMPELPSSASVFAEVQNGSELPFPRGNDGAISPHPRAEPSQPPA